MVSAHTVLNNSGERIQLWTVSPRQRGAQGRRHPRLSTPRPASEYCLDVGRGLPMSASFAAEFSNDDVIRCMDKRYGSHHHKGVSFSSPHASLHTKHRSRAVRRPCLTRSPAAAERSSSAGTRCPHTTRHGWTSVVWAQRRLPCLPLAPDALSTLLLLRPVGTPPFISALLHRFHRQRACEPFVHTNSRHCLPSAATLPSHSAHRNNQPVSS